MAEKLKAAEAAKRKMTQGILEEEKDKKQVYEFLEDDDDFEEFEQQSKQLILCLL